MTGLTAHLVKLHRRAQSLTSQETELETDQSDDVVDDRMETTSNHRETRTLDTPIKKKHQRYTQRRALVFARLDVWSHCGAPPPPNKPLGWCVLLELLSFYCFKQL